MNYFCQNIDFGDPKYIEKYGKKVNLGELSDILILATVEQLYKI